MRGQKGITLVALIITIVVLLILATVAITTIQDFDIIGNANKAAEAYKGEQDAENTMINSYDQYIKDYLQKVPAKS